MDCTCTELTGSGSVATAASKASFMMPIISGGNDAFEKSFISSRFCPRRHRRLRWQLQKDPRQSTGWRVPFRSICPDSVAPVARDSTPWYASPRHSRSSCNWPRLVRTRQRVPSGAQSPGERRESPIRVHCCASMTYRSWAKAVANNFGHRADQLWPRRPSLSLPPGEQSRAGRQRPFPASQRWPGP